MDGNIKRNYILFLVLSTLVIVGYSFIYSKDTKKRQTEIKEKQAQEEVFKQEEQEFDSSIPVEVVTNNEEVFDGKPEVIIPNYESKIINIESDLYTAKIDTLGAEIIEWNLKEYNESVEKDSPLVSIVNDTNTSFNTKINIKNRVMPDLIPYQYEGRTDLVVKSDSLEIDLSWTDGSGITIYKTLTFYPDKYYIEEYLDIKNNTGRRISERVNINWSNKVIEGGYTGNTYNFVTLVNDDVERVKKSPKNPKNFEGKINWFGYSDKYFLNSFLPNLGDNLKLDVVSLENKGEIKTKFSYPIGQISPNSNKELKWKVFLGPKHSELLKAVNPTLEESIDYGYVGVLTKYAVKILKFTNKFINNYGISIIVITIILRLIFLPITVKSMKSMKEVQVKMQALKPEIDAVKEKYKDDKQAQQTEMMKIYTSNGVNPLSSLGGCLPLLFQFPVFIALYFALLYSIDLRQSSFLWINDLAEPEHLFDIFGIPFRILPLAMGASWFFSQKLTPMTSPGSEAMELQMKMMQFLPLIMTVLFWGLPSGLILYWTVSNILSIGQQLYINRTTTTPLKGG